MRNAPEFNCELTVRRAPALAAGVRVRRVAAHAALALLLGACASPALRPDASDLTKESLASPTLHPREARAADPVPDVVDATPAARPRDTPRLERYSVVVSDVDIRELLFAMARDAKVNVDVDPRIHGKVSINAIEQTLPQILNRLARQVDLRYEFDGRTLLVQADVPYLHQYAIDYVNMTRDAKSTSAIATQISAAGGNPLTTSNGGGSSNNSTTQVTINTSNHFWDSLVDNVSAMLGVTASVGGSGGAMGGASAAATGAASNGGATGGATGAAGGSATLGAPAGAGKAAGTDAPAHGVPDTQRAVFASPEAGLLTVRATQREHERVQALISRMLNSAHRQVLIEATIAEVQLSEEYQQGVNWSRMNLNGGGWSFTQQPNGTLPLSSGALPNSGPGGIVFPTTGGGSSTLPGGASVAGTAATTSLGVLRYLDNSAHGNIGVALSLLQSFGKVKVLSSPKLSVLNNQTAVLKVVDNLVYFTISVNVTPGNTNTNAVVTYNSTANTVPVGFVMSVTPQIDDTGAVTINMRPTISRVISYVNDPNPALAVAGTVSRIPQIQTREIESVMKVSTGDIAVMGGLMQESVNNQRDQVPGMGSIPYLGNLFRYVNDETIKSELVIFLRPTVVHDASLEGDYASFRGQLPDENFFADHRENVIPREWAQ